MKIEKIDRAVLHKFKAALRDAKALQKKGIGPPLSPECIEKLRQLEEFKKRSEAAKFVVRCQVDARA